MIGYLRRQTHDAPSPLTASLVRGVLAYAAARDAPCWELKRNEALVWQTLEGFAAGTS